MVLNILIIILIIVIGTIITSSSIKKIKQKSLVPFGYKLFYTDQKNNKNKSKDITYSKLLYSKKYNLQGKPDYIFKKGKNFYPIELKSGKIKNNKMPFKGDLMQLVVYFLIIEDVFKHKPKKGKLIYSDAVFLVKNTKQIRNMAKTTIRSMRKMLKTNKGNPTCNFSHCKHCIYKTTVCEFYKNK